jgi:sulfotransferase family protein
VTVTTGEGIRAAKDDVVVDVPLVLVSQAPRSGGSLLAQLFDGHPQVYAHPLELRIGHPRKWHWPVLDPGDSPERWFDTLRADRWLRLAGKGYAKPGRNAHAAVDRRPFTFDEGEQRRRFLELVADGRRLTPRVIIECYFTSFFRTWGEWQPTGEERILTAFVPRLAELQTSVACFRSDYPDGKLISLVRDPGGWLASRVARRPKAAIADHLEAWLRSAEATRDLIREGGPWVLGILFEDLLCRSEQAMRRIAAFTGIDFNGRLLEPTYLGIPVAPNSSFDVGATGIQPEIARRRHDLGPEIDELLEVRAAPLYAELVALIGL